MFLINSRYSHFTATPKCFVRKGLHTQGHTLSRSYGVKLPSSLTKFNPIALGCSPHSPESVYGTGRFSNTSKLFLEAWLVPLQEHKAPRIHASVLSVADLPTTPPTRLHLNPITGWEYLLRPSYTYTNSGNGILTVFPSTTPIGLALGPD